MHKTESEARAYSLGRRHVAQGKDDAKTPAGMNKREADAYWDGVNDEYSERNPDVHTMLSW